MIKKYLTTKFKNVLAGMVAVLFVALLAVLGSQQTQFFRGAAGVDPMLPSEVYIDQLYTDLNTVDSCSFFPERYEPSLEILKNELLDLVTLYENGTFTESYGDYKNQVDSLLEEIDDVVQLYSNSDLIDCETDANEVDFLNMLYEVYTQIIIVNNSCDFDEWDVEEVENTLAEILEIILLLESDSSVSLDLSGYVSLILNLLSFDGDPEINCLILLEPANDATNVPTSMRFRWNEDEENEGGYLFLLTKEDSHLNRILSALNTLDVSDTDTVDELYTSLNLFIGGGGEMFEINDESLFREGLSVSTDYHWTVLSVRDIDFIENLLGVIYPWYSFDDEEELSNLSSEDYYIYSPFTFTTAPTATPVPELTIELSTTPVIFDNSIPSDVKTMTVTAKTNREAICFSDLSTFEVGAEFETTDKKTHTFRVEDVNLYKNIAGNFYFAVSCEDVDSSTLYTRSFIEYSFGAVRLFDLNLPSTGFTNSSVPVRVSLKDFVFPYMKVELSANNFENSATTRLLGAFCNPSSNLAVVRQSCNDLGLNTPSVVGPRDLTLNWNTTGLAPGSYEVRVTGMADNGKSYNVSSLIRLDLGHGSSTGSGVDCRNFRDVPPNHPQYLQVVTVCEAGFFTGQDTPSGRLADLQSSLIRAESFALACRMRGGNCRTINQNFILGFRDLTQNDLNDVRRSWMWGPLSGLQGIVRGYGDGTVRVEGFVSQVEFGKLAMESLTNIRVDDRKNPWFTDVVNYYNDCARLNLSDRAATRGEVVNIMYQTITRCSR